MEMSEAVTEDRPLSVKDELAAPPLKERSLAAPPPLSARAVGVAITAAANGAALTRAAAHGAKARTGPAPLAAAGIAAEAALSAAVDAGRCPALPDTPAEDLEKAAPRADGEAGRARDGDDPTRCTDCLTPSTTKTEGTR